MTPETLQERFARLRRELTARADPGVLDRPLSKWVNATDRHLPQGLLVRSVREIVALTYDHLAGTPGIGRQRLAKLFDVLERVGNPLMSPVEEPPRPAVPAPPIATAAAIPPDEVTEPVWRVWCGLIRSHRLDEEPLGRLVGRLRDLPGPLWQVPLFAYLDKPLEELRAMPGYGPARVGQLLDAASRLVRTVVGCPPDAPFAVRVLPVPIRNAALWADGVLCRETAPAPPAVRAGLLTPLLAQLRTDLGPTAVAMTERRIGLDRPAETLEQVAIDLGLTRERVRQVTEKAALAIQTRWPAGRTLLADVYAHLQVAGASADLDLLRATLDVCFGTVVERGRSRDEVLAAWDRAARDKQTPMDETGVRRWAAETFPELPAAVIRRWLEEDGRRQDAAAGDARYFGTGPLDLLFRHLLARPDPVPRADLAAFLGDDDRNAKAWLDRDPRFVEGEDERVTVAERCGFGRADGRWHLRLDPIRGIAPRAATIAVSELVSAVVGGLVQAGVCDATVWGVYRFAAGVLRRVCGGAFPPAVTPLVLAGTLIRHSDGLVRGMRRRRLRWDTADESVPVRGKRGWVSVVAPAANGPLMLEELDEALRRHYQDHEMYVLRQLGQEEEGEEGEQTPGWQCVTGGARFVPAVLVPRGWELDLPAVNVSPGVRNAAMALVAAGRRSPIPTVALRKVPWLIRLCDFLAHGRMRWDDRTTAAEGDG